MFELPNRYTDMQRISLIVDAGVQEKLLFALGIIFGGVVGLVLFRLATTVVSKHSHLVNTFIVMLCFFFQGVFNVYSEFVLLSILRLTLGPCQKFSVEKHCLFSLIRMRYG